MSQSQLTNQYLGKDYQAKMPSTNLVDQSQWKPQERSFDASRYNMTEDQTVEGRLDGILAKNSPLMQRAATQGMQYANQRGLLNSTMAVGAAQGAMIDRATPIAQQDASQAWQRGNQRLDHRHQQDMSYLQDELQRNQMALQQAISQGNDQLATQLQMEINNQQEHLRRGSMELQHGQTLDRDQAGYDHQRTMTELGHVLGMEHMEFAKNLDQRHQRELLEIGQEFQRLGQYEAGLTNTWNGMLNMMTQSGATTKEQMEHMMNQMMPLMQNTKDFYSSLYGNIGGQK